MSTPTTEVNERNAEFLRSILDAKRRHEFKEIFAAKLEDPEMDWIFVSLRPMGAQGLICENAQPLSSLVDMNAAYTHLRHRVQHDLRSMLVGVPKGEKDPCETFRQLFPLLSHDRRYELYSQAIHL